MLPAEKIRTAGKRLFDKKEASPPITIPKIIPTAISLKLMVIGLSISCLYKVLLESDFEKYAGVIGYSTLGFSVKWRWLAIFLAKPVP